jgi:hypothetical protein
MMDPILFLVRKEKEESGYIRQDPVMVNAIIIYYQRRNIFTLLLWIKKI